jgi:hypothetical protein
MAEYGAEIAKVGDKFNELQKQATKSLQEVTK